MTLYYAWNMWTDEIKMFRFEYARDKFITEDDRECNWAKISDEDLE